MFDITGHSMAQSVLNGFCMAWSYILIAVGTPVTHLRCLDEDPDIEGTPVISVSFLTQWLFCETFVLDGVEYITLQSV